MKKLVPAIVAFAALVTSASAEVNYYTDSDGVKWTIIGPPVGRWRPFEGAAQACPSHVIISETAKRGAGGYKFTADDRARNRETKHIRCAKPHEIPPELRVQSPAARPLPAPTITVRM